MSANEFSKSILKSSKIDAPLPHAKTRALAHVEHAMKASTSIANAAATTTNAITTSKLVLAIGATAIAAGSLGVGGGYVLAHLSPRAQIASTESHEPISATPAVNGVVPPAIKSDVAIAPVSKIASPVSSAEPAVAVDSCKSVVAESSGKCSVLGGHTVTFALKSNCSQDQLDVFWVDDSCHEIYRGMLSPSAIFWQDAREGHVFHLRDHVTHRLVKEFSPTAVEGAPDRVTLWKGAATEEPVVTIGDENKAIADAPPAECFHGGGRAAVWHFQNDRKDEPIALQRVDSECHESGTQMIEPGKKYDVRASEGHAFRIRDQSGALLMDIPPSSLDTSTYLTVP